MIYLVIIFCIHTVLDIALYNVVNKRFSDTSKQIDTFLGYLKDEHEQKRFALMELAAIGLGLTEGAEIEKLESERIELEEQLLTEKGRTTITEAEIEAIDTRLRELEEIEKELEISSIDASREIDLLKEQYNDLSRRNKELHQRLNSTISDIDSLLESLSESAEATEQLTLAKQELIQLQEQCTYYEERIKLVNDGYKKLKMAYDALDIEYAQLYEKTQVGPPL